MSADEKTLRPRLEPPARGSTPPARPRRPSPRTLWTAALSLIALWLLTGLYTIDSNERGVVTHFGRVVGQSSPGIHYTWPRPIGHVHTPRVTEVKRMEVGFTYKGELWTEARRSDVITGDENILKMNMAVQYKIVEPSRYLFETEEPDWLVERAVESALSSTVASMPVDEVLTTAKAEVEIRSVEHAQARLDEYGSGIALLSGNLQTVSPPAPVIEAFNDVTRAKKDSEKRIEDARVYESDMVPRAEGRAEQIVSEARGEAGRRIQHAEGAGESFRSVLEEYRLDPSLTRERLYLETIEELMREARVIVTDERSKVTVLEE